MCVCVSEREREREREREGERERVDVEMCGWMCARECTRWRMHSCLFVCVYIL